MKDEERTALEWYSRLVLKAELTAKNPQAKKDPVGYQLSVFTRMAREPETIKRVVKLHQDLSAAEELDKPLWSAAVAAKAAATGREV